jgi:hypothetical protein
LKTDNSDIALAAVTYSERPNSMKYAENEYSEDEDKIGYHPYTQETGIDDKKALLRKKTKKKNKMLPWLRERTQTTREKREKSNDRMKS